jgi:16S rRNA (uracil1498-N3)-methyltransferase
MHLFYLEDIHTSFLRGEEARHCSKVLRLSPRDHIELTDGKGISLIGSLKKVSNDLVEFVTLETRKIPQPAFQLHMAVCPTRKAERNEWMVEKMTEIGVQSISFVVSEHTHYETLKRVVNLERLRRITLSAMKQSRQYYLPELKLFSSLDSFLVQNKDPERYIAYVAEQEIPPHLMLKVNKGYPTSILIGPEGDFSPKELENAFASGFQAVSLGATRLRTETAAMAACQAAHLAQLL